MSIVYALVSKQPDVVVLEYTEFQGSFLQISRLLLNKINPDSCGIIKSGTKKFFYVNEEKITYMCLGDDISNEVGFAFIDDLKNLISKNFSNEAIINANPFGLKSLEKDLSEIMNYYTPQPITTASGLAVVQFKNQKNCINESLKKYVDIELVILQVKKSENTPYSSNMQTIVSISLY